MSQRNQLLKHPLLHPVVLLVVAGLISGVIFFFAVMSAQLAFVAYVVIGITIIFTAIDLFKALKAGQWGLDIIAVDANIATHTVDEYLSGLDITLMSTDVTAV